MATREISIVLRAKNMLQVGLAKAGASLKSFGSSVWNVGKMAAVAFTGAATAVAGFAAKAISAYAVQEKAVNAMASSFKAYGEEVSTNTKQVENFAAAIQNETGVGDEVLISRAARLKLLGVETSKLEEATKGTVALAAAGMEGDAAIKAMAGAMQGNYAMLTRYVPALKQATSEEEKAQIVKDLLTRGYQQQKDQLGTVAGQWTALKGRVGDAWEEFGKIISQSAGVAEVLEIAAEKVKWFGQAVSDWAAGGGVITLIALVKSFGSNVQYNFLMASNYVQTFFASIGDGADTVFSYVKGVVDSWALQVYEGFKFVGDYAVAVWEKIKRPWKEFTPPSIDAYIAALDAARKAQDYSENIITERTTAALAEREKIRLEYAEREKAIAESQLAGYEKNAAKQAVIAATASAAIIGIQEQEAEDVAAIKATAAGEAEDDLAEKVAAEARAMAGVVDANATAAEEVTGIWNGSLTAFADIEAQKVALASASAKEIADVNAATSFGSGGGTIETSSKYKTAKMRAAGLDPNMANGSVLTSQQSKALDSVTQEQILAELKKMNQNQESLLSFG